MEFDAIYIPLERQRGSIRYLHDYTSLRKAKAALFSYVQVRAFENFTNAEVTYE